MATSCTTSTFFVCVTMAAYLAVPIQSCPVKCTCGAEPGHEDSIVVICERQGLTSIPMGLPKNTTSLKLSYNNITSLDLRMLYDLYYLSDIDLSCNKISTFYGTFKRLKQSFIRFNLSHNNIEAIPWETFGNDRLYLNLLRIDLGHNPFNCVCDPWNSIFCDCSGDILNCTCNMQLLQEVVTNHAYIDRWNVVCQNPAVYRGRSITWAKFTTYACEIKYHNLVYIGTPVVIVVIIITACTVYNRKRLCHCYNQRNDYEPIPEGEEHLPEARQPNVSHMSTHRATAYQEYSDGNGETNPKVALGQSDEHIADDALPSEEMHGAGVTHRTVQADIHVQHRPVSERLPPSIATSRVTEKQLRLHLTKNLGLEWEQLAIQMKFTKAEIDKLKNDHRTTDGQIFAMLMAWKKREGSKATVGNLVRELEASDIEEEKFNFFLGPLN